MTQEEADTDSNATSLDRHEHMAILAERSLDGEYRGSQLALHTLVHCQSLKSPCGHSALISVFSRMNFP
jgi:hypothetical protein